VWDVIVITENYTTGVSMVFALFYFRLPVFKLGFETASHFRFYRYDVFSLIATTNDIWIWFNNRLIFNDWLILPFVTFFG